MNARLRVHVQAGGEGERRVAHLVLPPHSVACQDLLLFGSLGGPESDDKGRTRVGGKPDSFRVAVIRTGVDLRIKNDSEVAAKLPSLTMPRDDRHHLPV